MKREKAKAGKSRQGKDKKSFMETVWKIAGAFVVVILLLLGVNLGARYVIGKQFQNSIQSIADSYLQEITYRFDGAENYLANLVVADADVENVNYSYANHRVNFIQSAQRVNDRLNTYYYAMGEQFHFLVYYANHDFYNLSDRGALTIQEINTLKDYLKEYMKAGRDEARNVADAQWKVLRINAKWYAVNYSYYQEVYACCFVDLDSLEQAVGRIEFGENSYVAFASKEGRLYTHEEDSLTDKVFERTAKRTEDGSDFGYRNSVIKRTVPKADFDFYLVVDNSGTMIFNMIMQWGVLLIMFAGVLFIFWMGYYAQKVLLNPMQYFFEKLGKISEDEENAYFENSEILELEQANELYKRILDQAHQLKIEVYEKTEQQQKMQIEYMQLQIQPHFYINCMNMIYNMSCMGDEEGVQMMASHVSDYFRYIFGNSVEIVDLRAELRHVKNYLEICKMRYRMKMDYQIIVESNLSEIKIPPMILHTCVENSVKYGCKQGSVSMIYIIVRRCQESGREYITIEVTDDGPGFKPEIMKSLNSRREIVTDQGTRVGITNMIKRMEHIYGENFHIEFSNHAGGGARTWFKIPVETERKE